ncbi:UNVERIFIED_CONTAM: Rho GDP-dissociation inhibitor 1 [Sesamum radiatum]|uniref:Rho GDP-dissociation inhibitor 1 n=1 Tax=Sesamum radiatum TaxID=300843 RepID=A0AAW2K2F2_SESRA
MAQVLILRSPVPGLNGTLSRRSQRWSSTHSAESWVSVQRSVKYNGKFSCLFSDNRKQVLDISIQIPGKFLCTGSRIVRFRVVLMLEVSGRAKLKEQARKALESALGEKKTEFEKWDKEIKRREEAGGGGNSGGGGWFRWGGWFGGSDGDRFWQEAQQASLAILGILVMLGESPQLMLPLPGHTDAWGPLYLLSFVLSQLLFTLWCGGEAPLGFVGFGILVLNKTTVNCWSLMSLAVGVASSSKGMGFDENKAEGSETNKDHESGADNEGSISRKMSEASLYTTEDEDDEDTETKIQLGPQCTLKELSEKDKDDESLRRWKEQLLGSVDVESVGETLDPEVKILDLAIVSPGRDDILLPIPDDGNPQGSWFTLKEGSPYRLKFTFRVSNNIVSGLKYKNTVWKTGLKG